MVRSNAIQDGFWPGVLGSRDLHGISEWYLSSSVMLGVCVEHYRVRHVCPSIRCSTLQSTIRGGGAVLHARRPTTTHELSPTIEFVVNNLQVVPTSTAIYPVET